MATTANAAATEATVARLKCLILIARPPAVPAVDFDLAVPTGPRFTRDNCRYREQNPGLCD